VKRYAEIMPNAGMISLRSGVTVSAKRERKRERFMKHILTGVKIIGLFALLTTLTPTPASPKPPTPSKKFQIGQRVTAIVPVDVRAKPGGTLVGTQPAGFIGVITGGPTRVVFHGIAVNWWSIDCAVGAYGWIGEDNLIIAPAKQPTYTVWMARLEQAMNTGMNPDQLSAWIVANPPTAD
jgi:hypothetical protein